VNTTPDRGRRAAPRVRHQLDDGSVATSPLLEIANGTVHLYKQTFGRGPTQARARFAGSDILVVLLQDTMTVSERKLIALGEQGRVREHRALLRGALEEEMRSLVERMLVRRTLAAVNGIDTRRDVAAEVFLLAPVLELDPKG
jgi:uncharacterized protein YbcI